MMLTKPKKVLSLRKLTAKAEKVFNAYIRRRDADKPCITCNRYKIEHACHFYPKGHYSALRFNEDNVHGGCLQCNYFKHGAGNEYRRNLELRIGRDRLLILDHIATRHKVKKWDRIELEIIIQKYKAA